MALLKIDELNTPQVKVEPPEEYFSKMEISEEQKEERVETSKEISDVLLFLFALLVIELQSDEPDLDYVYSSFLSRFQVVVTNHCRADEYTERYINTAAKNIFDDTVENVIALNIGTDQTDAGWWTSPDRATAIGENEANSILNYEELQTAIDEGYVKKRWVTERDNRVRKTHQEVEGVTIPITEYFVVGETVMMMPHDPECLDEREIANCRCSLRFIDKNGKEKKYGK